MIRSPEYCSSDTPAEECLMHCPDEIVGDMKPMEILGKFGLTHVSDIWTTIIMAAAEAGFTGEEIKDFMCNMGKPGELFTSAG